MAAFTSEQVKRAYLLTYAPNEDTSQSVQLCSLIRFFVGHMKNFFILSCPKCVQVKSIIRLLANLIRRWAHMFDGTVSDVAAHLFKI